MINYLVPIVGVVWGVTLMAEHLAWNALAALALILLGVGVVSRRP
jgi:drug/metabolite transporter (DMT)-like permease